MPRQHKGDAAGVMINVRAPIICEHCKTTRLDHPPRPTKPPLLPNFIVSVLIMCLIFEIWQQYSPTASVDSPENAHDVMTPKLASA